jgi:hypothetical protein
MSLGASDCARCSAAFDGDKVVVPVSEIESRLSAETVSDIAKAGHSLGLLFSVPAAVVFLLIAVVSEAANSAFLVVAAIVAIVALPWSIVSLVAFLYAVPMNTGLHAGMDGYQWRVALAYSAPLITIAGAYLNGAILGRSFARRRSVQRYLREHTEPSHKSHA